MRLTRKDELKVGILAIILIVGVFSVILIFGNIDLGAKSGYEYVLHFTFLDGLRAGASVRFSGGILCGNVLKVYPDNKYAAVRIWVEDTIMVSENTTFAISTAGLIGEKYIIIKQRKDGGERLVNDTLIDRKNIVDPMNMDEALTKVNDIVIDINKISSSLSKYFEEGGVEDVGNAINNITSLIGTINDLIFNNKQILDESVKELTVIMSHISKITEKADSVMGVADRLTENLSGQELSDLVTNVNSMVITITGIVGTVGEVLVDTRTSLKVFLDRIDDFVDTTEMLISDIGPEISGVIGNVDTTFQSVGDEIKNLVIEASTAIGNLQLEMSVSLKSLSGSVITLSDRAVITLGELEYQVDALVSDVRRTVRTVDSSVLSISKELTSLTETSTVKIDETLTYIRDIAKGIKGSVDVFDPESLEKIMKAITNTTDKLENIAITVDERVKKLLDDIDEMAADVKVIIKEAKEGIAPTLQAIKNLSITLESLSKTGEEKLVTFFDVIENLSKNLTFLSEDGKNRIKDMFDTIDSLIKNLNTISIDIQPGLAEFLKEGGGLAGIVDKVNGLLTTFNDVIVNLQTDLSVTLGNIDETTYDISAFFEMALQVETIVTSLNDTIKQLSSAEGTSGTDLSEIINMLVMIRDIVESIRYIIDQLGPLLSGS